MEQLDATDGNILEIASRLRQAADTIVQNVSEHMANEHHEDHPLADCIYGNLMLANLFSALGASLSNTAHAMIMAYTATVLPVDCHYGHDCEGWEHD